MSPRQQASILTIMALMMGLGFVLVGTMIGVPTASKLAIDDMGTAGHGSASDALPSATRSSCFQHEALTYTNRLALDLA